MALFSTFLFVFSLRLGAIIIGILTLLKSIAWVILAIWGLECNTGFSSLLKDVGENQFLFGDLAETLNLYKNLLYYTIGVALFYGVNILICILLVVGAYQCKLNFIYPFLWSYILYVILLCLDVWLIFLMMKKQYDSINFTILYFSIAVFVLAYCFYAWCCIFSLVDVINVLQRQVLQKIKSQSLKRDNIPQFRKMQFRTK